MMMMPKPCLFIRWGVSAGEIVIFIMGEDILYAVRTFNNKLWGEQNAMEKEMRMVCHSCNVLFAFSAFWFPWRMCGIISAWNWPQREIPSSGLLFSLCLQTCLDEQGEYVINSTAACIGDWRCVFLRTIQMKAPNCMQNWPVCENAA